jgi:butyrate kinase
MTLSYQILIINPGSTSTKVALYENEREIFSTSIFHSENELCQFEKIYKQYPFRTKLIQKILLEKRINLKNIYTVVGRGGAFKTDRGWNLCSK